MFKCMGNGSTPRDSAFAVVARGKRVLLVRDREGCWKLPGGRLRAGEKPWHALRREFHEETGMRVQILGLTGVYGRKDGTRAVVFVAESPRDAEPAGPRHEIREQRWVRRAKARRVLGRSARRRLRDALAARPGLSAKHGRVSTWRDALRRSG
jgi:8-oxo-dGTP diphosphatase